MLGRSFWVLYVRKIRSRATVVVTWSSLVFMLGFLILVPPPSVLAAPVRGPTSAGRIQGIQATPLEMIRTPLFWVMYAMFVMMASGGLMAVAQLAPIAKDFKVADVPVSLIGLTMPALTFSV